eukprot:763126_1
MKINYLVTLLPLLAPSICIAKKDKKEQSASIEPIKVSSLRKRSSNIDTFLDESNAGARENFITMSPFFSDGNIPSKITVQFFPDESAKVFHSVSKRTIDTGKTDAQGNEPKEYFWSGEEDNLNHNSLNLLMKYDTDEVFRVSG